MLNRRQVLSSGAAWWAAAPGLQAQTTLNRGVQRRPGHILAIGGAEDRGTQSAVLRRFIALSGGESARIVVLTAASGEPEPVAANYLAAFQQLGVTQCLAVDARNLEEANHAFNAARLLEADGIFITGGDQRRLMATIGQSDFARSMRVAFHMRGACIAGTSAGAAALSRQMLAEGSTPSWPEIGIGADHG